MTSGRQNLAILILVLSCTETNPLFVAGGDGALSGGPAGRRLPGAPMEPDAGVKDQNSELPDNRPAEISGAIDIRPFSPETQRDHRSADTRPDIGSIVSPDAGIVSLDAGIVSPDAVSRDTTTQDSVSICPAGARGRCERFPGRVCSSGNDCGACAPGGPSAGIYCPVIGGTASACGWCAGSSAPTYCTAGGPECGSRACTAAECLVSRCLPC